MESSGQAEILQSWLVKCNVQHQSVYLECEGSRWNCIKWEYKADGKDGGKGRMWKRSKKLHHQSGENLGCRGEKIRRDESVTSVF